MSVFRVHGAASHKGHAARWVSFLALLSVSVLCHAQPVAAPSATTQARHQSTDSQAVGIRLGHHGAYRNTSVFWQTPVWWSHGFNNGWGHIDLMGEASVTHWDARRGKHSSLWQVGFAPVLRWWPSETPFYIEAGVGPTFVSRTRFADYGLATALQFGSHVGIGYVFKKRHQVSLRASHFSNASIKHPNDGLNAVQLDYAIRF